MNNGIIMTIGKKWAAVLTDECQLVKIRVQPNMAVGKEIRMDTNYKANTMDTNHKTNKAVVHNRSLKLVFLAAGVVLAMAAGLLFGQNLFRNPVYAVISVDVNPSLELYLDSNLEVLSVKAMNEEAKQILAGQTYQGLSWKDAILRWTDALRQSKLIQVQNMLLSAVMPEEAERLRTELMDLEGTSDQGIMAGVAVRVIYSNDDSVLKEASKNKLSVGRQMLLNQSQVQNQNWDKSSIADASLGDLIQKLLVNGEQNQTRLTERITESLMNKPGDPTSTGAPQTNRETNSEANGSGQQNGTASQDTNQMTSGQTIQNANSETNMASQGSASGNLEASGSTLRETSRSTLQTGEQSASSSAGVSSQSQQTSSAKVTAGR